MTDRLIEPRTIICSHSLHAFMVKRYPTRQVYASIYCPDDTAIVMTGRTGVGVLCEITKTALELRFNFKPWYK